MILILFEKQTFTFFCQFHFIIIFFIIIIIFIVYVLLFNNFF